LTRLARARVNGLAKFSQIFKLLNQPAAAFFFLRQPSRPNPTRPVAKSGSAAGSGTGETPFQLAVAKSSTTHDWPNGTVRVMVLKGTLETNP